MSSAVVFARVLLDASWRAVVNAWFEDWHSAKEELEDKESTDLRYSTFTLGLEWTCRVGETESVCAEEEAVGCLYLVSDVVDVRLLDVRVKRRRTLGK
jgi:hypothetical protein